MVLSRKGAKTQRKDIYPRITQITRIYCFKYIFHILFMLFQKHKSLYTLHELARLSGKSVIFLGIENCKSLCCKE